MKNRIIYISILILIAICLILCYYSIQKDSVVNVEINFKSTDDINNIEIYYNDGREFTKYKSILKEFKGSNDFQSLLFRIDKRDNTRKLRKKEL